VTGDELAAQVNRDLGPDAIARFTAKLEVAGFYDAFTRDGLVVADNTIDELQENEK